MKPVSFPGAMELRRPDGMTMEECGSLPVLQHEGQCISCWELDDEDLMRVLQTKRVWLRVWSGQTQPPVTLHTDSPFEEDGDEEGEEWKKS